MELLLAEVERKRKQLDSSSVTAKKKYFKRSELAVEEAEEYLGREKDRLKSKGLFKEDEPNSFAVNSPALNVEGSSSAQEKSLEKKYALVSKEDLIGRLRERNEPICLFGETHEEACQRLRLIEMTRNDDNKGLRNDFKAAMDRLDQAYLNQLTAESGDSKDKLSKANDVKADANAMSIEDITKLAENFRKGDMQLDSKVVLEFLRYVGYVWAQDLNARSVVEKTDLAGKLMSGRYEQTMTYLKPLFRKLKSLSLSTTILDHLTLIIRNLMQQEYVTASDHYLQMAIGNAPWPIGVTNPGIHARTGREKLSTSLVAHVLNDETQRKYIQGLKRLMTYCQKRFPTDPSKSLEYKGVE